MREFEGFRPVEVRDSSISIQVVCLNPKLETLN